jgi:hypothetical protein
MSEQDDGARVCDPVVEKLMHEIVDDAYPRDEARGLLLKALNDARAEGERIGREQGAREEREALLSAFSDGHDWSVLKAISLWISQRAQQQPTPAGGEE